MSKIISELLPPNMSCVKQTKDLIADCCLGISSNWITIHYLEFIHLLASESNEICEKENKKVLMGEHIIEALKQLGYSDYLPEVNEANLQHQTICKYREKRAFKSLERSGMTEEELLKSQEELFKAARLRLQQSQLSASESQSDIPPIPEDNS